VSEVFVVEEDHGDGDIVPEHSDHVLGQGEHLAEPTVVHAIRSSSERTADQVRCRVRVCRLQLHRRLPVSQQLSNIL